MAPNRIHVLGLCLSALSAASPQQEIPTFGTTVVIPSGLRGRIYAVSSNTLYLPDFEHMKPVGTVYTTSLRIWPRDFRGGFPGVTDRFEWFAIDYTGRFWVEKPGKYRFSLLSDDGSKLYIDERRVIDNDGQHTPVNEFGSVTLGCGIHSIRVSYFQGPRYHVALVLMVAGPGEKLRIFNTDEFRPPPNPEDWDSCDDGSKGRPRPNRRTLRGTLEGKPEPDPAAVSAEPATRRTLGEAMKERLESKAAAVLAAPAQPQPFSFRTAAYHFRRAGENSRSVLAFEVPGASLTAMPAPDGKTHRVHVFLYVRIRDAGGVIIDKFSRDVPYEIPQAKLADLRASPAVYTEPVLLPPGRYRIETAIWDGEGDRWSTDAIDVDSPGGGNGLGLSSIVLVRQVDFSDGPADYADPLVFQGKRFVPILPAALPHGLEPTAYFVVYRNKENPEAPRIRVEFLTGDKLLAAQTSELPPPDESYAIPMLVGLATRSGECEVRITAIQGGESATQSIRYSTAPN